MPQSDSLYNCGHLSLNISISAYATEAGYRRPTAQQRAAATTKSGSTKTLRHGMQKREYSIASEAFPAPLVLPGDELALDPTYPAQSVRSWLRLKERNEVTDEKRVIYVAMPPDIADEVKLMQPWSQVNGPNNRGDSEFLSPDAQDIVDYLAAFFHGLPVKLLPPSQLEFTAWEDRSSRSKKKPKSLIPPFIGLRTLTEIVRIRTRPSVDQAFKAQLNLDDLLDAAIGILPDDAYALLFLVHQDLFESPEDEFVCGRAYGASRVAVVSMARYNPSLDSAHEVEREHAWPASHCDSYIRKCSAAAMEPITSRRKKMKTKESNIHSMGEISQYPSSDRTMISSLRAAVNAHTALPSLEVLPSAASLSGLWLGRVCRTASHELGHCFGIDHCVYYACNMQGSASIIEDARQAPYLCPIDSAKLEIATGMNTEERYKALIRFCDGHEDVHLFVALAAWLRDMQDVLHSETSTEEESGETH